jgi:DNA-binding NarL/FixJ family response regulator
MTQATEPTVEAPAVLALDVALGSPDPCAQAMARILELLTLLVPSSVAVFYAVNHTLEKYAVAPIVAKATLVHDLDHAVGVYRQRYAHQDPFAPRHASRRAARVITPRDLDHQQRPERCWHADELAMTLAAELYLRAAGRVVAGISLMREPADPEISPAEIAVLNTAQRLFEHTYALASQASPKFPANDHPVKHSRLTAREREIAQLIARGSSNDEISQTLQIAPTTAKTHVKHVLSKLGVTNRRQALLLLNSTSVERRSHTKAKSPHPSSGAL